MRAYTQLTREERYQIYALKQAGHQQSEIAEMLGRHKSTISRELRRNRGLRGYRPKQAHRLALARRSAKVCARFDSPIWRQIKVLIRQDWSPEQIAGRLEAEQNVLGSAMRPSTSTSTLRSAQAAICTDIFAVRRSGASATGPMTSVASFPTGSRSMSVRPLSIPDADWATGKATS